MFAPRLDSVPKLSAAIQARREARGLSQGELAALAKVSANTVSRWESGRNRPRGKDALEFLKKTLGFAQTELDRLFLDWLICDAQSQKPRMEDASFLPRRGLSHAALVERLLEIDNATIPHLLPEDCGEVAQWAEIFRAQPHGWRLLVLGDRIVGYWHFLQVQPTLFRLAKAGRLREGALRPDDLAEWSTAYTGAPAHLLISSIAVDAPHQHPTLGMRLIRSLLGEINALVDDGFEVAEICTVACNRTALHLCQSVGMTRLGKQEGYATDQIAEVHAADFAQVRSSGFFRRVTGRRK